LITTLTIKNYALIEDIKVTFNKGLTVITGETGAGKTILLNALGLVLGKRADLTAARDSALKCVVEGEFYLKQYGLRDLFEKNDMDYEDETIIRRELLPNGKSRAFVNDTPVTLQQLQLLGDFLMDVHNQNDTIKLTSESYQMSIVDAIAETHELLTHYQLAFQKFKNQSTLCERLKMERAEALRDYDYKQFIFQELKEARLAEMDQVALEELYEKLNNVEEIQETLNESLQRLVQEETGGIDQLLYVRNLLHKIEPYGAEYEQLWQRLNSISIELQDVTDELEAAVSGLEADPQSLHEVHEKLQNLYRLQQKHLVTSVQELLEIEQDLELSMDNFSGLDDKIMALENEVIELEKQLEIKANLLSERRREQIPKLEEKLKTMLAELGLPFANFEFQLKSSEAYRNSGKDSLVVLFSANKGVKMGPIEKVASGGEMSRVMLVVKAILAEYKELPTIIFDEIDTGVSGEIAHKMAEILSRMSKKVQLFSITHLPQTAAKGDFHKKVYKADDQGMTRTLIKDLTQEERIHEIAQMIGGSAISDSALIHAKQLLN
jgi:DNA repair protein RecN (Recombination protein N)